MLFVVFVPVIVNSSCLYLVKVSRRVEESHSHVVRKHEDGAQHMVVVVVPDVFVSELHHALFALHVVDFEALALQVAQSQVAVLNAEALAVPADNVVNLPVSSCFTRVELIDVHRLAVLELESNKAVLHQAERVRLLLGKRQTS